MLVVKRPVEIFARNLYKISCKDLHRSLCNKNNDACGKETCGDLCKKSCDQCKPDPTKLCDKDKFNDGVCDDLNNNEMCSFDGGDCCDYKPGWNARCKDCRCKEECKDASCGKESCGDLCRKTCDKCKPDPLPSCRDIGNPQYNNFCGAITSYGLCNQNHGACGSKICGELCMKSCGKCT